MGTSSSLIDGRDHAVALFSEVSRPALLLVGFLVLAVVGAWRGWRSPLWLFPATLLLVNGLVNVLKPLIGRERPPMEHQLVAQGGFAMPSGHAAAAAVVAVLVTLLCSRWWVRVLVWVWAVAVMASRLYLGVHWLSDVLVGALLGAVAALLCALGERKVNKMRT